MTNESDRKTWSVVYDRDLDNDEFLTWLQKQHAAWEAVNFPMSAQVDFHSLAGMTEELGELAHALLKTSQGIRGSEEEHDAAGQDAVGDLIIYCAGLCNKKGWNMQSCVYRAWIIVGQRDWTKNKVDGGTLVEGEHLSDGEDW